MKSDYDRWFVSKDGTQQAIKCNRENFLDCLRDLLGPEKAAQTFPLFRKASFSEQCKLELELMEG